MLRFRMFVTIVAALAAVAAGCSSDGESASTPTSSAGVSSGPVSSEPAGSSAQASSTLAPEATVAPTTTAAAVEAPLFTAPGPFQVGVLTIDLGDRQAEVWYPAQPDPSDEPEIFDTLTAFPPELAEFIPDELSGLVETGAYRDAPVDTEAEAAFPLVIYSHGFGGFRQVATAYTTHLASWGYVVASTDHLERGLAAQATNSLGGGAENQDVLDVLNTIDAVTTHPALETFVDAEHVAITGHSAGGFTAARAANEDVIDTFISISSGLPDGVDAPTKPALVVISELDAVVTPDRSYDLFDGLTVDATLVNIENAGHNSFTDSCAGIYDMGGLEVLAELIGEDQVARAEDGCVEPFIRPEAAQDVLHHYTVALLRSLFLEGEPEAALAAIAVDNQSDQLTPLADFQTVG